MKNYFTLTTLSLVALNLIQLTVNTFEVKSKDLDGDRIAKSADYFEEFDDPMESEYQIKRSIQIIRPLMQIFKPGNKHLSRRDTDSYQPYYEASNYGSGGYGGGGCNTGCSSGYGCCTKHGGKEDLLPILALAALSLLLLYLVLAATTTTMKAAARDLSDNEDPYNSVIEHVDAPSWLTLVDDLWKRDLENPNCSKRSLCVMNQRALISNMGWLVSLSSLPLSYLLHHRQGGGFVQYLDASTMGRSGANCSIIYHECSALNAGN